MKTKVGQDKNRKVDEVSVREEKKEERNTTRSRLGRRIETQKLD